MRNCGVCKALLLAVSIIMVTWFAFRTTTTTSLAQTATSGRYQLYATELNVRGATQGTVERRPQLFRIDIQSGDTWALDTFNNKWVRVNNP